MKAIAKRVLGAAAAAVLLGVSGTAMAAPMINLSMEGRVAGTQDWLKTVRVNPGDLVEYRLMLHLIDPTTQPGGTITNDGPPERTYSTRSTNDGILAIPTFDLFQLASDGVQISFQDLADSSSDRSELNAPWDGGADARDGTPTQRVGAEGLFDLRAIKINRAAGTGVGALTPEAVMDGTFVVGNYDTASATEAVVRYAIPANATGGSFRINSTQNVGISVTTEATDPYVGFSGLTIQPVPEPASLSLLGLGAMALLGRRRRNA